MIEIYFLGESGYVLRLWKVWIEIKVRPLPERPSFAVDWADNELEYFSFGLFSEDIPERLVLWRGFKR